MMRSPLKWLCVPLLLVLPAFVAVSAAGEKSDAKTTLDVVAVAKNIDSAIEKRLAEDKLTSSAVADDAEFLRRVYLDITGVIPTAEKTAAFLDSKEPNKRARLIDDLLTSPEYGRHLADIWTDMLLPRTSDNRRLQTAPLFTWLEEQFNKNRPWNELVYDLVTATGTQDKNGAVTFFLANPTVDKMTDYTSKLFLGMQLQCAQCHNHPFTKWKQSEYWGMAAFFMKVRSDNVNKAAKTETAAGVNEAARAGGKNNQLPESAKKVPAKFLLGAEPKLKESEPYRPVLASWMTAADNPFFARAMVNRMWSQLFGRGFVYPVDDMHEGNTPTHPELLQSLTREFTDNGFNLKDLIRSICNSQTYQRTSKSIEANENDERLFSHTNIKPLTPEQLFDSLVQVIGKQGGAKADRKQAAAGNRGQKFAFSRDGFTNFFRGDEGADLTEYQTGIPQVLRLMNADQMNRGAELLDRANKAGDSAKTIEVLYLGTLSRRPTKAEADRMQDYVTKHDKKTAYGDILWALLNSSEFALNR